MTDDERDALIERYAPLVNAFLIGVLEDFRYSEAIARNACRLTDYAELRTARAMAKKA